MIISSAVAYSLSSLVAYARLDGTNQRETLYPDPIEAAVVAIRNGCVCELLLLTFIRSKIRYIFTKWI